MTHCHVILLTQPRLTLYGTLIGLQLSNNRMGSLVSPVTTSVTQPSTHRPNDSSAGSAKLLTGLGGFLMILTSAFVTHQWTAIPVFRVICYVTRGVAEGGTGVTVRTAWIGQSVLVKTRLTTISHPRWPPLCGRRRGSKNDRSIRHNALR